jgi:YggT family protein
MESVFLFLFRTFVDFITIVLILRLIASRISLGTMKVIILVLRIFFISILAHVILSWLSPNNFTPAARFIGDLVAPVMRPIQRRLPHFAGLDFSPMIALVIIQSIIMIIPVNAVFSGILCTNFKQML